ncbi:hypothetical protein THAOC_09302, partial [Thalassiosira oceanica]
HDGPELALKFAVRETGQTAVAADEDGGSRAERRRQRARDHYRKGKNKMVEELDCLLQASQDDESDSVASWEEPFNMN